MCRESEARASSRTEFTMTGQSQTKGSSRESVFDVDVERLARVYALAVLDAAGDAQDSVMEELGSLVTEVLDNHADLDAIFGSALIALDEKLAMLDRLFANQLSGTTLSFLKVLAKHGRLGYLRAVARSAKTLWDERNSHVQLELQLAHELDDALHQEVVESLRITLGFNPVVTTRVNPDLIGGIVLRIGDKVYDASARTQLEKTRHSIVERAVENIQKNPETFIQN